MGFGITIVQFVSSAHVDIARSILESLALGGTESDGNHWGVLRVQLESRANES